MFKKALISILALMLLFACGLYAVSVGVNRLIGREVAEVFDVERNLQCLTFTFLNKSYTVDLGAIKGETLKTVNSFKSFLGSCVDAGGLEAKILYEKMWKLAERLRGYVEEQMQKIKDAPLDWKDFLIFIKIDIIV
ncbi:MAG TPA: hypothetical protein DEA47_02985 [Peptococcaceae bacterium]|nr:MAG: hypothetical protein XD50_1433 [Clostridia bacterium 41_269]HBT20322.1 hypothetical protein [Peptococcaceae bacterium]